MSSIRSASSRTRNWTWSETCGASLHVVQKATWSGDQDVHTAFQVIGLLSVANTAIDESNAQSVNRARARKEVSTWAASSRVGSRTSTRGPGVADLSSFGKGWRAKGGGLAGAGLCCR